MIGGKKVDILSLRRLIDQRGQVVQFYIIKDENELVLYLLLISSPLESRSLTEKDHLCLCYFSFVICM